MSSEDRKAAILAVVIPLIAENGASVTTAEIAHAAGVAEGTLYRVFPDKITLLIEAVKAAIDPTEITTAIAEIDPTVPLADKLTFAGDLLVARIMGISSLINAIRSIPHDDHADRDSAHQFVMDAERSINTSLTHMLAHNADDLSVEPEKAAAALRGVVFAAAHPLLSHGETISTAEAIDILVSGIVVKASR